VEAEVIGLPARWLGRSATTWLVTALVKSVELPHGPINIPLLVKGDTHHILEIPLAKLSFIV
jgi:hypothetical protein